MAEAAPGLADLQRWMIGALHGDEDGPPVDIGVLAPSPTMTALQCLDVYRHGYRLRLLECLRAMHPGLLHLAGEELFDAFALDYLAARPPRSYSLSRLGDGFADHLAATRPDRDAPDAEREVWPDLLIDVVRFEGAFLEVYDGPGVEGGRAVSSTDVPIDPDGARLVGVSGVPCLRMLRSRFPVGEYVCAVRRGEQPSMPAPRPTYEALVRRNYVVELLPLTAASSRILETLLAGADVAQAADACGTTERQVLGLIRSWADRGLFSEVAVATRREATCS